MYTVTIKEYQIFHTCPIHRTCNGSPKGVIVCDGSPQPANNTNLQAKEVVQYMQFIPK